MALADTTTSPDTQATTEAAAPAAPEATPLMYLLKQCGAGDPLDAAGLRASGYIEGGYTYSPKHGSGGLPPPPPGNTLLNNRYFDLERGNHFQLDQVELSLQRPIADKTKFDVGGGLEWLYGMDSYLLHANGVDFYSHGGDGTWGKAGDPGNPLYQFNLAQAFIDVNVPVLGGLNVRTGLFYSIIGYETVNPATAPFYSHSFLFTTQPTHWAGFLLTQTIDSQWAINAAVFRGEEQSPWKDNNGAVSGALGVTYTPNDKVSLTVNVVTGPEMARADFPGLTTTSHYTTVLDVIGSWQVNDNLTLAINGDFGATSFPQAALSSGFGDWYGVAAYGIYKINDYCSVGARAEWFYDSDSLRLGVTRGGNMNMSELTVGTTITPFPNHAVGKGLKIRPEVRWDHAEDPVFNNFGGRPRDRDQLTLAFDVVFAF